MLTIHALWLPSRLRGLSTWLFDYIDAKLADRSFYQLLSFPHCRGAPLHIRTPAKPGNVALRFIGPGQFGAMFGAGHPPPFEGDRCRRGCGAAFMTRDGGQTCAILVFSGGQPFTNLGYRGTWGVAFDPKRPYEASGSALSTASAPASIPAKPGVWRSAGQPQYTIHAIAIDPTDSKIVDAASGVGRIAADRRWAMFGRVWTTALLGMCSGPAVRDRDPVKGRNWVTVAIDLQSVFVPGKGHSRIDVCGQGGFYISEDAGDTCASLEASLPGGDFASGGRGDAVSPISGLILVPGEGRSTLFASIRVRATEAKPSRWSAGSTPRRMAAGPGCRRNRGLEEEIARMPRDGEFTDSLLVGCRVPQSNVLVQPQRRLQE